jgi:hypothetical protein
MNLKKQVDKIKENWLILLLVVILVVVLNGNFFSTNLNLDFRKDFATIGVAESGRFFGGSDFAPEVEDRIKTISSSFSTEIERGEFTDAEEKLKGIIENYDAFLLNENVRKSETGFWETRYGTYTIKVNILKYNEFILKLKEIGEVQSFNENTEDITGQYTDLNVNLELEKERLVRYNEMYNEAKEIADKIELNDRIFNQERTIKYLEDRIDNLDKKIDYATIYFSMNEERSGYSSIALIKLSELVKAFVSSINNLLQLFFVIIPWVIFGGIIFWVYKKFKKK